MEQRLADFDKEARKLAESEAVAAATSSATSESHDGSNESIDDEEPVQVEELGHGRRKISSRFIALLVAECANP